MIITSKPPHYLSKISKNSPFISLETNSMSTQVFGDYDNAHDSHAKEMKSSVLLE